MYLVDEVFLNDIMLEMLILSSLVFLTLEWRRASAGFLAVTPRLLDRIQLRHIPKFRSLIYVWAAMVVVATLLDLFDNRHRPLNFLAKTEKRLLAFISIVVVFGHVLYFDAHNINAIHEFRFFMVGTAVPLLCMAILVRDRKSLLEWGIGAGLGLGVIIAGSAITTLALMYRLPLSQYFLIRKGAFLGWRLAFISDFAAWGTILAVIGLQLPNQRGSTYSLGAVALLLSTVAVVGGASRATFIGLAVTFVVFGYFSFIKRRSKASLWPFALTVLLVVVLSSGSRMSLLRSVFLDRFFNFDLPEIQQTTSFQGRLERIKEAWPKFLSSPVWGVGIANGGRLEYLTGWGGYVTVSSIHGTWILVLTEQGLLGFIPFAALYWRGVARSFRTVRYSSSSSFYAVGLSCLLTLTYLFVESLLGGTFLDFLLPFLSCIVYDVWQMERSPAVSDRARGQHSLLRATAATARRVSR